MSEPPRKLYWDSSCFICLLNDADYERARRIVIEDILEHASKGNVEIWTSTYTIVEVIRPKRRGRAPLPAWAIKAVELVEENFPEARTEMETLWNRYQANDPSIKLTPEQIEKISAMFEWDWIKLIELNEMIANDAVGLCRDNGLKTADAIHVASAIAKRVSVLQRYDRDFDKVRHRNEVEDPKQISPQANMFAAAPRPEDFKAAEPVTETAKAADKGGPSESGS
jgi:predicted nucleic acid-binding protein